MDLPDARPRRVSVVGSTGTGKTAFARDLAGILGTRHVELDAIFWGPNWSHLAPEEFQARMTPLLQLPSWVIDGNYGGHGIRQLVWAKADTIIWLDFPLTVIFARLWRRTTARIRDGAELWPGTGNRETIRGAFFSRESLFWWAVKTYRRRRRIYTALFAELAGGGKRLIRFTRTRDADRWLESQRALSGAR